MGHDTISSSHLLATLVILACGLVPDRLYGDAPSRLRESLQSNLFNRADLERVESGYYERLLEAGRRLDDLADLPSLRIRRRKGSTWSIPVEEAPLLVRVDDLREVALKPGDATTRWGLEWRTNAQGMRDREYARDKPAGTFRIALVGDSIGAGWGVNVRDRFESILETVWDRRARRHDRTEGRDHQLCSPRPFPRTALVSLQPDRMADGSRPGDLRVDGRGCRLGRAAAALPARAGAGLGLSHLQPSTRRIRRTAPREPGRLQAGTSSQAPRHPGPRVPEHGRRLPVAEYPDRLGAGPPRRPQERLVGNTGTRANRAQPDSRRSSTSPMRMTVSTRRFWPSTPTTTIPIQEVTTALRSGSITP